MILQRVFSLGGLQLDSGGHTGPHSLVLLGLCRQVFKNLFFHLFIFLWICVYFTEHIYSSYCSYSSYIFTVVVIHWNTLTNLLSISLRLSSSLLLSRVKSYLAEIRYSDVPWDMQAHQQLCHTTTKFTHRHWHIAALLFIFKGSVSQ
jgi:hypothetical protein